MSTSVVITQLADGMLKTMGIFFFTLLFSIPLGLLVCIGRMSRIKPISALLRFYISIMRGTPLMLQLLVVYFGPYYLFGIQISMSYRLYAVILAFSINYAAYFAEIYRGGFQSIPQGQREAAQVLGYSKTQAFVHIQIPQMFRRVLPSITNEVITLVKDTSLAFAIAYAEMFTIAKQLASAQASVQPYLIAGLFYYIFNFVVAFVMEKMENSVSHYRI